MNPNLTALTGFALSAIELVVGLGNGLGLDDMGKALEVVKRSPAVKHASEALAEYKAMTDEQAAVLEQYVKDDFDIADDKVEAVIEGALGFVVQLHSLAELVLPKPTEV